MINKNYIKQVDKFLQSIFERLCQEKRIDKIILFSHVDRQIKSGIYFKQNFYSFNKHHKLKTHYPFIILFKDVLSVPLDSLTKKELSYIDNLIKLAAKVPIRDLVVPLLFYNLTFNKLDELIFLLKKDVKCCQLVLKISLRHNRYFWQINKNELFQYLLTKKDINLIYPYLKYDFLNDYSIKLLKNYLKYDKHYVIYLLSNNYVDDYLKKALLDLFPEKELINIFNTIKIILKDSFFRHYLFNTVMYQINVAYNLLDEELTILYINRYKDFFEKVKFDDYFENCIIFKNVLKKKDIKKLINRIRKRNRLDLIDYILFHFDLEEDELNILQGLKCLKEL